MKSQFGDLKKNFRGVVDNIRTNDFRSFQNINKEKAAKNDKEGAYNKLNN